MASSRRSAESRRQASAQMSRFAEELRVARAALGLSKRALATRADVARSTIDRAEGEALDLGVGTLTAIAAAADLDLILRTYPRRGRRVRDAHHAALVESLRHAAVGSAWRTRLEVGAGDFGRSADLVMFGPSEVLHIEVERRIVDLQAQLRSGLHKRDAIAAKTERPVRFVLVVEDVRGNREALRPHDALLGSQLPATSRQIMRALRTGEPLGQDGLLWRRSRAPVIH